MRSSPTRILLPPRGLLGEGQYASVNEQHPPAHQLAVLSTEGGGISHPMAECAFFLFFFFLLGGGGSGGFFNFLIF
jgi:hypothetical protein